MLAKIWNDHNMHNSPQAFIDREDSVFLFNGLKSKVFDELHFRKESPVPLTLNLFTYPQDPQVSAFFNLQLQKSTSSWKCKGCKITIKALATTIFFTLLKAALPAAVIAAVAAFLGLGREIAEEFIRNLGGCTIDEIAEALCRKIALCP